MHISQAGFIGEVDQVLAVFQQNMEEAGRAALPLKDCNINVNVVCAEKGIVSSPFVFGSDIGGSVSNSINVTKPALRRRAKENSEPGSTTKRPRVEVCGYLQNVNQLISCSASEGDKYFTATLQRSSGNVQVLVFNQRLHQDFCDAQIKQKPVILNNVRFEELQRKVIFSQTSQLSYRDSLDFKYDFKSSEPKTVASVLEVKQYLAGELINITGTITDKQEDLKDVKGRQMMRRRHSLADHSDVITLTGWGDKCNINPGSCYTFSHVRVKKFDNQTELTLTPQTKLTEVPAPGDKVDVCSRKNSRTFKVLGASVQNWHKCYVAMSCLC